MRLSRNWTTTLVWVLITTETINTCSSRDYCERKQYQAGDGFRHAGRVIVALDQVTLDTCVKSCRRYLECRSFNMKWMTEERRFGRCELLQQVIMTGANTVGIPDQNSTHYYWCPSQMTYYLRAGLCYHHAQGLSWDAAISFCRSLYPGAHLIDIKSGDEQTSFTTLAVTLNIEKLWLAGRRPPGGLLDEFYWNQTGEAVNYTNWYSDQPRPDTPTSDCIAMTLAENYQWNDLGCQLTFYDTICQW